MFLNVLNESAGFGMDNLDHIQPTNNGYDGEAGAYQILFESATEWGNLTMAMANLEAKAFLESNDLLLEAGMSSFVDALSDFFQKAWAKIQELFKQFTTWLQASVSSDQKFVSKFKDKVGSLASNLPSDFKYKMVDINLGALNEKLNGGVNAANTKVNAAINAVFSSSPASGAYDKHSSKKESYETDANAVRGGFTSGSSAEKGEFKKEFVDAVCGGDSSAKEMEKGDLNFGEMLDMIKGAKKQIDSLKTAKDNLSKMYAAILKSLRQAKAQLASKGGADKTQDMNLKVKQAGGSASYDDGKYKFDGKAADGGYTHSMTKDTDGKLKGAKASNDYKSAHLQKSISELYTFVKEVSGICTEAYGIAISLTKKCRAQYRGCLTKALTAGAKGVKIENEGMSADNLLAHFGYMG